MFLLLDQNRSTSDIFPGDNPAYGSRNIDGQNSEAATVNGRTEHIPSTSVQERDFDNPIYSSDVVSEDPYTLLDPIIDAETSTEDHYTVPNSPPCNIYDRVADDRRAGGAAMDSGVYYSVINT